MLTKMQYVPVLVDLYVSALTLVNISQGKGKRRGTGIKRIIQPVLTIKANLQKDRPAQSVLYRRTMETVQCL